MHTRQGGEVCLEQLGPALVGLEVPQPHVQRVRVQRAQLASSCVERGRCRF